MSEETKRRIIEAGAELIHQRGYNNTGLKDILRAADVPKGSFYFYFDNKEAFGIEMMDHYSVQFQAMMENVLQIEDLSPLGKLRAIFDSFQGYFESQGYTRGCPVGNLAQEMSDLSEPFRARLMQSLDGMTVLFSNILDKAKAAGEIPEDIDSTEAAIFIIEAWHGALVRMKATKDGQPLEVFAKFIFNKVLK